MPVPYMGSKRGSAGKIVSVMAAYCPDIHEAYDVFCGGFAISEKLLERGFDVYASDLNAAVVNLIRETLFGECIDPVSKENIFEHPRFIDRQEFTDRNAEDDWFAGYVKCIWSFGNNNKGYLYSPDNEKLKKLAHDLVVDGNTSALLPVPMAIQRKIVKYKTFQGRRRALCYFARKQKSEYRNIELERLRSLENLQRLRSLENLPYDKVGIKAGAIIYCDPPYIGTAEYIANDSSQFDHEIFYDWCREKSKTNPVFISEYHCPDDFKCIYEFERRQTLSKGETKYNEKLFYLDNRSEK